MKAEEIRDWDNVEIRARLGELKEEKFRLRFRLGTMQLENPKMLQHIRRDVARLTTILRERELTGTPEAASETPTPEAAVPPAEAASETPETTE
jgi:large subunit ribosomal protein L29